MIIVVVVVVVVETEGMSVMKKVGRMVGVAVARSLMLEGSSYSTVTDLERHTRMNNDRTGQH